jgi:hypothetical protein
MPVKRTPPSTSDRIIDDIYLLALFAGTILPELKAFYEEYIREISTYELMKKLPVDELKEVITNLYAHRNLGPKPSVPEPVAPNQPLQLPLLTNQQPQLNHR